MRMKFTGRLSKREQLSSTVVLVLLLIVCKHFTCCHSKLTTTAESAAVTANGTITSNIDDQRERGDRKVVSSSSSQPQNPVLPHYWGCQDDISRSLPYCNGSLSIDERINDLVRRLTIKELVSTLSPKQGFGHTCETHTSGVSRIGFPPYMWLTETNTAVASACFQNKCATQFAGPMSMASSFNRTSWYLKGSVFGTEQRALSNLNWYRGAWNGSFIGLTAYGPNINQQRDPRFGRSSELPGEDPFVAGEYAKHMVLGMQEQDSRGYPKVLAYLKHFTAYSRETNRGYDTYNISLYDLYDTYLSQYEKAMVEGKATGVMCSYNGINGHPSCANGYLLNTILRQQWGRPDAHVTTDCGAVANLLHEPVTAPENVTAAAYALLNGTDLEMGSQVFTYYLADAVRRGLVSKQDLQNAFRRSYRPHFVLGRFDDPTKSDWYKFGVADIASKQHQQIQLEAALQGLVLLKNSEPIKATNSTLAEAKPQQKLLLPLSRNTKIAVLGPLGVTRKGLMSDYEADQSCPGGTHDCVPTLAESIAAVNGEGMTTYESGVDVDSNSTTGIHRALTLAGEADVIVLCLGITKDQEREGKDRTDIKLPGLQEFFAKLVFHQFPDTPVVLVLVNGGQLAIDNLVDDPVAIVEAFNPNSIGGTALALSLFGVENRWGKLPYTIYPYDAVMKFDMSNYDMSKPPGRTHRYFTGTPIYPFGYGLTLTSFEIISCESEIKNNQNKSDRIRRTNRYRIINTITSSIPSTKNVINVTDVAMTAAEVRNASLSLSCVVRNTGNVDGDEVLQLYHIPPHDLKSKVHHPVPIQRLVGFMRVRVSVKGEEEVRFFRNEPSDNNVNILDILKLVNESGKKVLYPGRHTLKITNGNMKSGFLFFVNIEDNLLTVPYGGLPSWQ